MIDKFTAMTQDMERLNNYAELHHDWPIGEYSMQALITRACNSGGFVGANSANVHGLERVDENTISFKASISRTKDTLKIHGLCHTYIYVYDTGNNDYDAQARATIYWDMDK